jgi:hypothetical protein
MTTVGLALEDILVSMSIRSKHKYTVGKKEIIQAIKAMHE